MTERINVHTVSGRQQLIAKIEDINAGLHQLDLHIANVEKELAVSRQIITSVWRDGMSIYDPAIQNLIHKLDIKVFDFD